MRHRPTCLLIQEGKCESQRHEQYQMGLKARKALDRNSFTNRSFSDDQHEFVEQWLSKEFVADFNLRQLDYCLRVLQVEFFIRVLMDIDSLSYANAEQKLTSYHCMKLP